MTPLGAFAERGPAVSYRQTDLRKIHDPPGGAPFRLIIDRSGAPLRTVGRRGSSG